MTTKADLIGLGNSPFVADVLGDTPTLFAASGTAVGSAAQIPGRQFTTVVNTGTSAVKLPKIGGDSLGSGGLLGHEYSIVNMTAAVINIFAANNDLGSVVTFFSSGVSIAGTAGASLSVGKTAVLKPITVSTWVMIAGVTAA